MLGFVILSQSLPVNYAATLIQLVPLSVPCFPHLQSEDFQVPTFLHPFSLHYPLSVVLCGCPQ